VELTTACAKPTGGIPGDGGLRDAEKGDPVLHLQLDPVMDSNPHWRLRSTTIRFKKKANGPFYALIEAFREMTGVPMVLNTSFNENEPILCKPAEALDGFLRTKMDVLVLGNSMLVRQ
jgi:hypothetical protein